MEVVLGCLLVVLHLVPWLQVVDFFSEEEAVVLFHLRMILEQAEATENFFQIHYCLLL